MWPPCAPNAGTTGQDESSAGDGVDATKLPAPGEEVPAGGAANAMVFVARRDGIKQGEQVQVSYLDAAVLGQPARTRRAALEHYLFDCACARCVAEDQDVE